MRKGPQSRLCPKCGSENIASILYGLPAISDELTRQLDEGYVILVGCLIYDDSLRWHCTVYGTAYSVWQVVIPGDGHEIVEDRVVCVSRIDGRIIFDGRIGE